MSCARAFTVTAPLSPATDTGENAGSYTSPTASVTGYVPAGQSDAVANVTRSTSPSPLMPSSDSTDSFTSPGTAVFSDACCPEIRLPQAEPTKVSTAGS